MTRPSAERRFQQMASAALLALSLVMAHAAIAGWLALLGSLQLVAGSVTPRWSLTRWVHRYFVAPLRPHAGAVEDPTPHLQADAALGTLAFGGAVFVFAGVAALGWALIGSAALLLVIDATLDRNLVRGILPWARRLSRRPGPEHGP